MGSGARWSGGRREDSEEYGMTTSILVTETDLVTS